MNLSLQAEKEILDPIWKDSVPYSEEEFYNRSYNEGLEKGAQAMLEYVLKIIAESYPDEACDLIKELEQE